MTRLAFAVADYTQNKVHELFPVTLPWVTGWFGAKSRLCKYKEVKGGVKKKAAN